MEIKDTTNIMTNKIRAAILIRRNNFAKIYLENEQIIVLRNADVQNVLGYAEWGDIGYVTQTPKGIKFSPDSDTFEYTFTPYKTTGKEMIVYEH